MFVLSPAGVTAQTPEEKIQNADWFERQVGAGVTWKHYHFDSLFNSQQDIWYADVDLSAPGISVKIPYLTGGATKTVSQYAASVPGCALAINGNFGDSMGTVQYLKVDGTLVQTTKPAIADEAGIIIDATGNGVSLVHRDDVGGWAAVTEPTVMATNVMLVRDGILWTYPDIPFYQSDRHPRTAMGITTDNHLLLVAVDGRSAIAAGMSFLELQRLLKALGSDDAINLDGGGSTTMWGRGEPNNGVLNTPSDGSERSVVNAVAIVAATTSPLTLDSRFIDSSYNNTMISGDTQTVWMEFQNYGTQTWTSNTVLGTTEPRDRVSEFFTAGDWVSNTRPGSLDQSTVAPSAIGKYTFTLTAPTVSSTTIYTESFGMVEEGMQWIGPEQNTLTISVLPPGGTTGNIYIESRAGGLNNAWYSETGGWADSGTDCTAPGLTGTIGQRYGSTYRSVAGTKAAQFTPLITNPGEYSVYVAWGAGSNRRNPITYKVTHTGGIDETHLDQAAVANQWVLLGTYTFTAGTSGYVEVSNEDIDVAGNMFAAGAMFEPVASEKVSEWLFF
jgi:hypothetical protein